MCPEFITFLMGQVDIRGNSAEGLTGNLARWSWPISFEENSLYKDTLGAHIRANLMGLFVLV